MINNAILMSEHKNRFWRRIATGRVSIYDWHSVIVAVFFTLFFSFSILLGTANCQPSVSSIGNSQSAILTAGGASNKIVIFSDPLNSPATQTFVPGLPANVSPHGLAYVGNDLALIGDFANSRIFVVKPSVASLVATIPTTVTGYNGSGTIASPPQQNFALAIGNSSSLNVIQAPFTASSAITSVALPGSVQNFQTQAIVFNSFGRAFVRHSAGISVLDAPYTSVAFTITIPTGLFAAIAISPDGNTLLATGSSGITNIVFIYNAPFSATSVAQNLGVVSGAAGIKVSPDGTKAIVVSSSLHVASAISAPFSSASNVQSLPLPAGINGFEDVDISSDGQSAILAGRSNTEPAVLLRAPFTSAGVQSSNLPINDPNPNRGGGGVRFRPIPTVVPTNSAEFDFDGDGKTDISIFRPSVGEWYYLRSGNGAVNGAQFGAASDKPVPADYTGDGKTDIAFFRPSSGEWYILRSEDFSFFAFPFGLATDILTPGDFDGDGKADVAVFRPSNGVWYINKSTGGTTIQPFGTNGDRPVVADYDGDGKSDIAIFRPSVGEWYYLRSSDSQVRGAQFGASTDKTVQGDYTGDGKADFAFFRPSEGRWYVLRSEDFSFFASPFGVSTDTPTIGDYDGDGKFDQAVFRPSNGVWYVNKSNGSGVTIQQFGVGTDLPVPSYYLP